MLCILMKISAKNRKWLNSIIAFRVNVQNWRSLRISSRFFFFILMANSLIFSSATLAKAPEFEHSELVVFVQQAKNYFLEGTGCALEFSFDDRLYLVEEFLTIESHEIWGVISGSESEISIFLERPQPQRPGLSLQINLNGRICKSFYIYELMT